MKIVPNIWALIDHKSGNSSQILGLLQHLNWPYTLKEIKYNTLINLPNLLKPANLFGIDLNASNPLTAPFPDIVITAGRRTAPIALHLKRQNPKCFLIQIMNPEINYKNFDLIIIPEHDKPKASSNIIRSLGAMHNLTNQKLNNEANLWSNKFQHLPKPFISLILGGNSKHGSFTSNNIFTLVNNVNHLAQSLSASLLISTSRRTPPELSNLIKKTISVPKFFYDFNTSTPPNPYFSMLALGEIIIVTGDSISMCSEACYTGKPVYIFAPDNILGKKHYDFFYKLTERKYAHLFENNLNFSSDNQEVILPLNEAKRIAEIVKQQYFYYIDYKINSS